LEIETMQSDIGFLRRRHYSLMRAVENLNRNRNAFEECEEIGEGLRGIFDRILKCLSEVNAIRTAIEDKISEMEGAS
jgi:Mg2+ and Co2+ transporter CorA